MAHVRTQLRNAVKSRLETVPGIRAAHNPSRLNRNLQTQSFPCAFVNVDEVVNQSPGSFAGEQPQTRSFRVTIQLGVIDDSRDPEAGLDDLCVDVEKTLVKPDFGIGRVAGWRYTGSGTGTPVEIDNGDMISQILTYTADIMTLDSAPDQNLHA